MKAGILAAIIVVLATATPALCAGIADIPWTKANLEELKSADVLGFINSGVAGEPPETLNNSDDSGRLDPSDLEEYEWTNMYGDDRYQLIVVLFPTVSDGMSSVVIYGRDKPGKFYQTRVDGGFGVRLEATEWGVEGIQDLNGDGKKELIIPKILYGGQSWPEIYCLANDKAVECGEEFPSFYKNKVVPRIDNDIALARDKAHKEAEEEKQGPSSWTRDLHKNMFIRAKILVLSGLDPDAMKKQAAVLMDSKSPDYDPYYAMLAYRSIGDKKKAEIARVTSIRQENAYNKIHHPDWNPVPEAKWTPLPPK